MFKVLFPSCMKQDFSKALCLRQALGFIYPAILRNNVNVFCVSKGHGLYCTIYMAIFSRPTVRSAFVCHVSPVLGTSILPWQGLCSGCHCRHCSVPCLAPRAHCCSQFSPDPGRASSRTGLHVYGASVPLPREYDQDKFARSVCCGIEHGPAEGSQGGG